MLSNSLCNRILKKSNAGVITNAVQNCLRSHRHTGPGDIQSFKLVVVGGGTGGAAVANSYASHLGKGRVAVVEPSDVHYYQPLWTLVGGGLKQFSTTQSDMSSVLPRQATWLKEAATEFDPEANSLKLKSGKRIKYDFLVVAMGLQLDFHKIPGLTEALNKDPRVCSNYSSTYVHKTFPAAQALNSGNALFTFPVGPIKCAGAPLKICFLIEDYLTRSGKRETTQVAYHTALPAIFGVPKYARSFQEIADRRNISVNPRQPLVEVRHQSSEAVFESLDQPGRTEIKPYSMLHVAPPCSTPTPLASSPLADTSGFADVDKETLQSTKYNNVFSLGDCSSAPTSKTAAGIASQKGVLMTNLDLVMSGKEPRAKYDGYTSCPLVTSPSTCVLAEFGYDGRILETFPIDQAKERHVTYFMKSEFFPRLYWHGLVKGLWHGPRFFRRLFNFSLN